MTNVYPCGRLGNQIIRNIAISLLAKKNDLHVTYSSHEQINKLGIDLFCGTTHHDTYMELLDENYMTLYEQPSITYHFGNVYAFLQTKDVSSLIYQHLHSDNVKNKIIENNPFRNRYQANNDACIHIRLGDVAHFNPGLYYYESTLSRLQFDTLYLTTDQKDHDIIQKLISSYPNAVVIEYDEIQTFQFASTCKHIILSHGSFSALIGYLAYFSHVYYPKHEAGKMWHGDIFSIPGWNKI
jgi:hypothetical protein